LAKAVYRFLVTFYLCPRVATLWRLVLQWYGV
jgi:hypothetical protein